MPLRRKNDVNQLVGLITLAAMLIGAGIWLGSLQQRIAALEHEQLYFHGKLAVPSEEK